MLQLCARARARYRTEFHLQKNLKLFLIYERHKQIVFHVRSCVCVFRHIMIPCAFMSMCVHVRVRACMCMCVHVYAYVRACVCACVCAYPYVCAYDTCVCICLLCFWVVYARPHTRALTVSLHKREQTQATLTPCCSEVLSKATRLKRHQPHAAR